MFNAKLPLTKEFILKRIQEEDIFERYLGFRPDYRNQFCNPLRKDNHPSCNFYVDKFDRIKFADPAGGFNWDCFNVVEYTFRTDFRGAMKIIATDFGLTEGVSTIPHIARAQRSKEKIELRVKRRPLVKADLRYWFDKYYQTDEDLHTLSIFPISHAWYLRQGVLEQFYVYRMDDPCYCYHFGGYDYKLYFPFREKGNKFRQNRGDIIQGLNLLPPRGHILLNTKAYKDVACIRKFTKYFDIHSIATMGETQMLPADLYYDLTERFDYILNLFDLDAAGIRLARRYKEEYNTPYLFFNRQSKTVGIKDFSDYLEIKRFDETLNLMKYVYSQVIG